MAAMTRALDPRSVARWFRLVALLEAISWAGLLIGMYFKYLGTPRTEIGVKVFGAAHGAIFVAFVAVALLAGLVFKWAYGTWLLAALSSILPMCSVIFVIWADRTGRIGVGAVAGPVAQPGLTAPEST
ncbi:DUF3817 domain-containing protein [Mycolicibacterium sp. XJ879]